MIKQAVTMVAWAAIAAAPSVVRAQATTPPTTTLATCDCPVGDARGELRDLAAFAPLGLLGAMAAAGGTPGLFAGRTPDPGLPVLGGNDGRTTRLTESDTPITESARSVGDPPPSTRVGNSDVPMPVPPDSLRGGIRAPNTGTPLPSVFLIGSGLIALGCVTLLRSRS
ncbi:MAG: hypothetical protein V4813_17975 [Gemmatimonadota bacterium]